MVVIICRLFFPPLDQINLITTLSCWTGFLSLQSLLLCFPGSSWMVVCGCFVLFLNWIWFVFFACLFLELKPSERGKERQRSPPQYLSACLQRLVCYLLFYNSFAWRFVFKLSLFLHFSVVLLPTWYFSEPMISYSWLFRLEREFLCHLLYHFQ